MKKFFAMIFYWENKRIKLMAHPAGFEPAIPAFGVKGS